MIVPKLELVWCVTFNSQLILVDIPSGEQIASVQGSNSKIFEFTYSSDNESLILLDSKGNIFNVNINKDNIAS